MHKLVHNIVPWTMLRMVIPSSITVDRTSSTKRWLWWCCWPSRAPTTTYSMSTSSANVAWPWRSTYSTSLTCHPTLSSHRHCPISSHLVPTRPNRCQSPTKGSCLVFLLVAKKTKRDKMRERWRNEIEIGEGDKAKRETRKRKKEERE